MKRINFIIVFTLLIVNFIFAQTDKYAKVRVYINNLTDLNKLLQTGVDIDCQLNPKTIDKPELWISYEEIKLLQRSGLNVEVIIPDWDEYYNQIKLLDKTDENYFKEKYGIQGFGYGSMGGFYTFNEVVAQLDTMKLLYPSLITERQAIGYSIENRPIWMVKISDNPDLNENEPQVLYTALHHAREPQGMMTIIYYMYYLLEKYGIDPEVTYLVNNREIYFIPVVNPDGYEYNRTTNPGGGGMWRKNRRNNGGSYGVDLNRNYGPYTYWDAPNGGSSTSPSSDTYRGTAPFSEPETATIRDFLLTKGIKACLNYHTYSNLLIYPYGALSRETPDSLIFREFARDMTAYNGYVYGTDQQTVGYSTRGNSDDYMYDGEPISIRPKIFAMTPEVGSSSDGFWPSQSRIFPLAIENLRPNLYYTWIVGEFPSIASKNIITNSGFIKGGDTIKFVIELKNKGLSHAYNIGLQFESLSSQLTLIGNSVIQVDTLPSRTSKSNQSNPLLIKVANNIQNGSRHKIVAKISINGTILIKDTTSILVGQPTQIFADNFESGTSNWQLMNSWGLTSSTSYSPPNSMTDSPAGLYPNNANTYIVTQQQIDLTQSNAATLEFWTRWDIEAGWDFAQVKVSTNNGSTWIPLSGKYTKVGSGQGAQPSNEPGYDGTQSSWVKEEMDLSNFLGKNIKLQFLLKSDGSVQKDGWYIDNVVIKSYQQTSNIVTSTFSTSAGWNLISVPLIVDDFRKSILFPSSVSSAYAFNNQYVVKDTLENGIGYWLKFNGDNEHTLSGQDLQSLTINVRQGWNLVGVVNGTVPVANITTNPPNIIQGQIYGYQNGYVPVTQLQKGKAYWIKCSQNGSLTMTASYAKENAEVLSTGNLIFINGDGQESRLKIESSENYMSYELPPVPPSSVFDVRFEDRFYNSSVEHSKIINLSGVVLPIRIKLLDDNTIYRIEDGINGKLINEVLTKSNEIVINNPIEKIKIQKLDKPIYTFNLSQNYPNPFNSTTYISFSLPERMNVKLKIYDVLGNEIVTLLNSDLDEGKHTVKFDGSDLSSGIYFYKLITDKFTDVKKMILMK
ncbi:MAG: M14 family zinc carboxypeptidase [Ignavibacteria bacterium]